MANTPDQALYYPGMRDSNYLPLNGKHSYVLHFAPGQAPPTDAGGFWSLTVYNSAGQLVNSAAPNVYSNGPLVTPGRLHRRHPLSRTLRMPGRTGCKCLPVSSASICGSTPGAGSV